ncbi:MAG: glutamyl-tRNA reductase [Candidatus Glassbacteria bacterium]|nr:glutamyl-tRNA reductase [Candidatus Glassbacteria bacterium]
MPVALGGLNHKIAPVQLREKLAFSAAELEGRLRKMQAENALEEVAVLSTCNRTEVYVYSQEEEQAVKGIEGVLGGKYGKEVSLGSGHFYFLQDLQAVSHLFRVASSLDSMVLGESQILGQVREAYRLAQDSRTAGRVLSRLFQQAVKVGKRARAETAIGVGAVSVSSAAVDLARKIFGDLSGRQAIILGAGETSELTLSLLVNQGVDTVLVANRTYSKAVQLAVAYHGSAVGYDEFPKFLSQVDILISSTGAPGFILGPQRVGRTLQDRARPIFMIDLAMPRDIDPALADYENCFLYNLDDLEDVVRQNATERTSQVGLVEEIVASETADFMRWYESLAVVPLLRSLHENAERIRSAEVDKALNKLGHLSPEDRERVERLTSQIVKKVLHSPTSRLRKDPRKLAGMGPSEMLRFLFGLDKGG